VSGRGRLRRASWRPHRRKPLRVSSDPARGRLQRNLLLLPRRAPTPPLGCLSGRACEDYAQGLAIIPKFRFPGNLI